MDVFADEPDVNARDDRSVPSPIPTAEVSTRTPTGDRQRGVWLSRTWRAGRRVGERGDFAATNSWGVQRRAAQRVHGPGNRLLKLSLFTIGIAAIATVVWLENAERLSKALDKGGRISAQRIAVEAAVPSPESAKSGPPGSAGPTGPAPAIRQASRVPTAAVPVELQLSGAPAISKQDAPADKRLSAVTSMPGSETGGSVVNSRATGADAARLPVFVPSERIWPSSVGSEDRAGQGATPNAFASFSSEGEVAALHAGAGRNAGEPLSDADLGLDAIDRAFAMEASRIEEHVATARVLSAERDFNRAAAMLRDVLANDPGNLTALRLYGDILIRDRQPEAALEIFDAVLAVDPSDGATLINRGKAALILGRPGVAVDAARAALALSPDSLPAISLLSRASAAAGAMPDAMAGCERVGILSNSKSEAEWCRAAAQNQAGNRFDAVSMFIAALNTGERDLVQSKQLFLQDLGFYTGPIDGVSNQSLIDAVTACAVAKECVL